VQHGRCLFWIVAPFHGQHVAVPGDNDSFPPTGGQFVPGNPIAGGIGFRMISVGLPIIPVFFSNSSSKVSSAATPASRAVATCIASLGRIPCGNARLRSAGRPLNGRWLSRTAVLRCTCHVRSGSKTDKPSRAKFGFCPLLLQQRPLGGGPLRWLLTPFMSSRP
jgi:hypothetical protein